MRGLRERWRAVLRRWPCWRNSHTGEPLGVSAPSRGLGLPKSTVADLCAAPEATRTVRGADDGRLLGYRIQELDGAACGRQRDAAVITCDA